MNENKVTPNRLIHEKSPYLLQHAYNPVDWFPWGEEAFAKAELEHKPIFLSIGYSTCYWCHVMEREVFENARIAELMNTYVVSIKVDREELPNVDRVYMSAAQAMTGSGGWPLSAFLTPDRKPFYIGTYIPPRAQYGRPGFVEVLEQIRTVWENAPEKIITTGNDIAEFLKKTLQPAKLPAPATHHYLDAGFQSFAQSYDEENAGFGSGTKFPRPVAFNFLFRYYDSTDNIHALSMSLETLKRIVTGGMRDHIGGGFHRYSTDPQWRVPHFEKMLYDQAQIVISLIEAHQITHAEWCTAAVRDTLEYVHRAMTSPEGGFFSAEDAESAVDHALPDEKEEGEFYVWGVEEIADAVGTGSADIFNYHFGVQPSGNAPYDPHNVFTGKNILYEARTIIETATKFSRTPDETIAVIKAARKKLFEARELRPKPNLDDKILVSWNGLMVSAFARASQVLDNKEFCDIAERAAKFILDSMWDAQQKHLFHRWRAGESRFEANLEDYAFLTQGLLDLYEASFDEQWIAYAIALTERQIELFYDTANGGFYDAPEDEKYLLLRDKNTYDGAEPSGNSIAILNLLRLSLITAKAEWRTLAEHSLDFFSSDMEAHPQAMAQYLVALDWSLSKSKEIIVAGNEADTGLYILLREIHSHFLPNTILLHATGDNLSNILTTYLPFIKDMVTINDEPTVYVCENFACRLPVNDLVSLRGILATKS